MAKGTRGAVEEFLQDVAVLADYVADNILAEQAQRRDPGVLQPVFTDATARMAIWASGDHVQDQVVRALRDRIDPWVDSLWIHTIKLALNAGVSRADVEAWVAESHREAEPENSQADWVDRWDPTDVARGAHRALAAYEVGDVLGTVIALQFLYCAEVDILGIDLVSQRLWDRLVDTGMYW